MAATTSSVIFSLKELALMEDERVRAEAEASRLETEAREAARLEGEARRREELAAREREEAARARETERSEREAAARVEAIHRAALEAARIEAEARVRADAQDRERARELRRLELASAEKESGARRSAARSMRLASATSAIAVVCVAAGLYAAVVVPAERARAARSAAELASRDVLIEDVRQEVRKAEEQTRSVAGDLVAARDENARLQAALEAAKRHPAVSHAATPAPAHASARRETWSDGFTSCPPDSKDPLCAH
jgi:hypothetical protein